MWFKLYLDISSSLSGVFGKDGCLYWRVVEVGVLCQMIKPYRLHKVRSLVPHIVTAQDILPQESLFNSTVKGCKLVNTDTVIAILKWWKSDRVEKFLYTIQDARFKITFEMAKNSKFYKSCFVLKPHPEGIKFYDWIASITQEMEPVAFKNWNNPSTSGVEIWNYDSQVTEPDYTQDSQLIGDPMDEIPPPSSDPPLIVHDPPSSDPLLIVHAPPSSDPPLIVHAPPSSDPPLIVHDPPSSDPSLIVHDPPSSDPSWIFHAVPPPLSDPPLIFYEIPPSSSDPPLPKVPSLPEVAAYETTPEIQKDSSLNMTQSDASIIKDLQELSTMNTNLEFRKKNLEQALVKIDEKMKLLTEEILRLVRALTQSS